jgi:hypothetical protein
MAKATIKMSFRHSFAFSLEVEWIHKSFTFHPLALEILFTHFHETLYRSPSLSMFVYKQFKILIFSVKARLDKFEYYQHSTFHPRRS